MREMCRGVPVWFAVLLLDYRCCMLLLLQWWWLEIILQVRPPSGKASGSGATLQHDVPTLLVFTVIQLAKGWMTISLKSVMLTKPGGRLNMIEFHKHFRSAAMLTPQSTHVDVSVHWSTWFIYMIYSLLLPHISCCIWCRQRNLQIHVHLTDMKWFWHPCVKFQCFNEGIGDPLNVSGGADDRGASAAPKKKENSREASRATANNQVEGACALLWWF